MRALRTTLAGPLPPSAVHAAASRDTVAGVLHRRLRHLQLPSLCNLGREPCCDFEDVRRGFLGTLTGL